MTMKLLYIFIIPIFFIGCFGEAKIKKPEKNYSQEAQILNELTNMTNNSEDMAHSSKDIVNDTDQEEISKPKLPILKIMELLHKGSLSHVRNDYGQAIDYYEKSLDILNEQKNIQYGNSKNTIKYNEGRYAYDMVLSDYKTTIFNELEYYLNFNIGKGYLGICQRPEDNHNSLKYCNKAIIFLKRARIFLNKTKYKNKKYTDVTFHLGFSYMLLKDSKNGKKQFAKANKERPFIKADKKIYGKEGRVFTALGIVFVAYATDRQHNKKEYKDKLETARKNFKKALKLEPENHAFINNVGEINYKLGNYKKSIEYYSEAIFINPIEPILYSNRGLAYLKVGQFSKACKDFEITKELDINNIVQNTYKNLISDGICR